MTTPTETPATERPAPIPAKHGVDWTVTPTGQIITDGIIRAIRKMRAELEAKNAAAAETKQDAA